MTTLASKEDLADTIAQQLDPDATAITKERVREQCKECKEEFYACFLRGMTAAKQQRIWIAQLKAIKKTCEAAAQAVGREPQEIDWRPTPAVLSVVRPILVRFIDRFVEQTDDHAIAEKFKAAVAWFDLVSINSTELLILLLAWSRLAGGAAQQLTPDARSIPKQDFLAYWAWVLMHEFASELVPIPDPEQPLEGRTAAQYIAAHWSRLSPDFRTAHNRLLQARGLLAIPLPAIDEFVRPRRVQKRQFPWTKYLTVTGLLAQYVVGPNAMKFETACGRMLGYKGRKRRSKRPRAFAKPTP
jgi:hypothetical protein